MGLVNIIKTCTEKLIEGSFLIFVRYQCFTFVNKTRNCIQFLFRYFMAFQKALFPPFLRFLKYRSFWPSSCKRVVFLFCMSPSQGRTVEAFGKDISLPYD